MVKALTVSCTAAYVSALHGTICVLLRELLCCFAAPQCFLGRCKATQHLPQPSTATDHQLVGASKQLFG